MAEPLRSVVLTSCAFPETHSSDGMVQLIESRIIGPCLKELDPKTEEFLTVTCIAGVICAVASAVFAETFATTPTISILGVVLTVLCYTGFCVVVVLTIAKVFSDTISSLEGARKSFLAIQVPEAILDTYSKFHDFVLRFRQDYSRQVEEDQFNLLDRQTIPALFYGDAIFKECVCPITGVPIRHPVKEPVTNAIYERAAIEAWINLHHTSPLTRGPLEKQNLIPANDVEERINNRLRQIQEEPDELAKSLFEIDRKLRNGDVSD